MSNARILIAAVAALAITIVGSIIWACMPKDIDYIGDGLFKNGSVFPKRELRLPVLAVISNPRSSQVSSIQTIPGGTYYVVLQCLDCQRRSTILQSGLAARVTIHDSTGSVVYSGEGQLESESTVAGVPLQQGPWMRTDYSEYIDLCEYWLKSQRTVVLSDSKSYKVTLDLDSSESIRYPLRFQLVFWSGGLH